MGAHRHSSRRFATARSTNPRCAIWSNGKSRAASTASCRAARPASPPRSRTKSMNASSRSRSSRHAGAFRSSPGTGSNATAEAIRLTASAREMGADGALLISPYYNKPTQEGIFRHYKLIAASVDLPLIVYNIPGRTGSNIAPETFARLCEIQKYRRDQGSLGLDGPGVGHPPALRRSPGDSLG